MNDSVMHDFGIVAEHSDCFEFHIDGAAGGSCRLVSVLQTERGPRRSELAEIAGVTWRKISGRVVRELAQAMNETELVGKKAPSLRTGANCLSPLVGRELALLLWALQEEGALEQLEAILHGWREKSAGGSTQRPRPQPEKRHGLAARAIPCPVRSIRIPRDYLIR